MCWKCRQQALDIHANEYELPHICVIWVGDYSMSFENEKKEIMAIKHKDNIPYHEICKMLAWCETTADSQAFQRGNTSLAQESKYEQIVKKLFS